MRIPEKLKGLTIPVSKLYGDWYLVEYEFVFSEKKDRCVASSYDIRECDRFIGYTEILSVCSSCALIYSKSMLTEDEFFEALDDPEVYETFKKMYMPSAPARDVHIKEPEEGGGGVESECKRCIQGTEQAGHVPPEKEAEGAQS